MSMPLILPFVSTVAFAIQFLIFAYLYSSHRVRFFHYLLWAWASYTVSKGLKLVEAVVPELAPLTTVCIVVATIAATGFTVAAALAHRRDYRLRPRDVVLSASAAVAIAATSGSWDADHHLVNIALGALQIASGMLFWSAGTTLMGCRGQRLLGGSLAGWGGYRIASQFVDAQPGTTAYWAMHAGFLSLYFLATFAVIIIVLERARSESDSLHARLRKAERLAATGELAAGMAHEIRNPLAAIVNATALLTDGAGLTDDERAHTLAAVRTEARRLNRILSDFLRAARPEEPRVADRDIREVVNHVTALIRNTPSRAARVDVSVAVDPTVPRFAFDRDQIIQVLWNVALNGVEAMNGRGRLSMEVTRQNGDVALTVSDTGNGIAAANLRRVFEPFYSDKPNGSGLGLTIAQRIVGAHGGRIEVDSEPGLGTRVTMLLPINAH
jgi:signal transduction histidine kinase